MQNNYPKISVFIPTKDRSQSLDRALKTLYAQTYKDFEVVVIDEGELDGKTFAILQKYSKLLRINYHPLDGNLVAAHNEAIKISKGEIFVRTDDDIEADPRWLAAIMETFQKGTDVGGVTGPTIIPSDRINFRDLFGFQDKLMRGNFFWRILGTVVYSYFMEGKPFAVGLFFKSGAFSLGSNYRGCLQLEGPVEVDHHEACNMAIRKDLLEKLHGFDEGYIGTGEYCEPDTSFRIRRLGYKIFFNSQASIHHLPNRSGGSRDNRRSYGVTLNFVKFYFRNMKPFSVDKLVRFLAYLSFINCYYTYKALTSGQRPPFCSISGTMHGIRKYVFTKDIHFKPVV